jgi:ribosome maturation factor RimP
LEVREEVRRLATPLAEEAGYELVDVEHTVLGRSRVVRVMLDKPGGITVGDCAGFSRRLSDCIDMNQVIAGSYRLEVSSPGIERPLKTLESVARFSGQTASLTTFEPRDGRRNYEGTLLGPEDGRVGVRVEDGGEHWFDWAEVKSARLVMADPWGKRRGQTARARGGTG